MKLTRVVEIEFDYMNHHFGDDELSIRTSERDDFGRMKYQSLPLDDESKSLLISLKDWIARSLK